jgi:hypothetical protein
MFPLAGDTVCTHRQELELRDELLVLFRSFIEYMAKILYFLRGSVEKIATGWWKWDKPSPIVLGKPLRFASLILILLVLHRADALGFPVLYQLQSKQPEGRGGERISSCPRFLHSLSFSSSMAT